MSNPKKHPQSFVPNHIGMQSRDVKKNMDRKRPTSSPKQPDVSK
ncbi:MAG: small acid-soluble spore protein N [Bacilli bacterium]